MATRSVACTMEKSPTRSNRSCRRDCRIQYPFFQGAARPLFPMRLSNSAEPEMLCVCPYENFFGQLVIARAGHRIFIMHRRASQDRACESPRWTKGTLPFYFPSSAFLGRPSGRYSNPRPTIFPSRRTKLSLPQGNPLSLVIPVHGVLPFASCI